MSNDNIEPLSNGNIPLSTLTRVLADDVEQVASIAELNEHYPTAGRVAELTTNGTIYVGDGDQWLVVDEDSGFESPTVSTAERYTAQTSTS